jgi:formate dehydrogenase assembly factor FdhD
MSENVISSIADIEELTVSADGLRVDVKAKIDENSLQNLYKEKTLVSGCGGGVTSLTVDGLSGGTWHTHRHHIPSLLPSELQCAWKTVFCCRFPEYGRWI